MYIIYRRAYEEHVLLTHGEFSKGMRAKSLNEREHTMIKMHREEKEERCFL